MASPVLWRDFRRERLRTANNKSANWAQSESLGKYAMSGGIYECFETFFCVSFSLFLYCRHVYGRTKIFGIQIILFTARM